MLGDSILYARDSPFRKGPIGTFCWKRLAGLRRAIEEKGLNGSGGAVKGNGCGWVGGGLSVAQWFA